jgi:hypothetical protein
MHFIRLGMLWSALAISSVMTLTFTSPSWTGEDGQSPRTVTGEVLKITGTFAVVKGPNGKGALDVISDTVVIQNEVGQQVALRVSRETKQDGVIDAGDKVEASVAPDGHIISIRPAEPSQTSRP